MIHCSLLVFMQRVQHAAAREYHYYIVGAVEEAKFEKLAERFQTYYGVNDSKYSRHRRRARGEAVTVLHAVRFDQKIHFCLMSTSGKGRVTERERLNDLRVKSSRLKSPCGKYQLIHDGRSWSWAMTKEQYQKWRERIHIIAALPPERRKITTYNGETKDPHIEKILDRLYAEPGFRMVRKQIGQLVVYLDHEWSRHRPTSNPRPYQRTFLSYVRILPVREKTLQQKLTHNMKKRAFANGQTLAERKKLAQEKHEHAEIRRRFRAALKCSNRDLI